MLHIVSASQIVNLKEFKWSICLNLSIISLWHIAAAGYLFQLKSCQFFISIFQLTVVTLIFSQSAFCLPQQNQF